MNDKSMQANHPRWIFAKSGLLLLLALLPIFGQTQVLEQLMSSALSSHPSSRAQALQLESSQAGLEGARWQFYPTPSVAVEKANSSPTDIAYQGDDTVTTLRLQQPLWTGGRLTAGVQKAKANLALNQALLAEVRQQLALRVLQNYGDWLGAYLKNIANQKSMATHSRLRAQVARRIEMGVSSDSDLVLAVARIESLASDISVTTTQQEIALARLGQMLGQPVDANALRAAIAAPYWINSDLQQLIDQTVADSPAVMKAQAQAALQESMMAERRSDFYPEVYLRAELQHGNYAYRNMSDESRIFIGLSSHFGAGLSSSSGVAAASAQYQAALAEVETQTRSISEQVLADHALAASSKSRLSALQVSLRATKDVSESYDRQFLAGRKTWLDVMNAARELAQTEIQLADIESTQVVVTWRLAINTQGLAAVTQGRP